MDTETGHIPAPTRAETGMLLLACLAALALGLLLQAFIGWTSGGSTSNSAAKPLPTLGPPEQVGPSASAATAATTTATPGTRGASAPATASTDPLRPPIPPTTALVYPPSAGKGCTPREDEGTGLRYGIAECNFWQDSGGLLHGGTLPKGPQIVVCQADLGRANPVWVPNQTNTYWVWVRTLTGAEDWFPLTAVSEGESNQPVPQVPLCQR